MISAVEIAVGDDADVSGSDVASKTDFVGDVTRLTSGV